MKQNKKQQQLIITNRGKILIYFCFFLFFILLSRLVYLQIYSNEIFLGKKNDNITKTNYLTPERGGIYDRNNVKIADSKGSFSLTVVPERLKGFRKNKEKVSLEFVNDISKVLELSEKEKSDLLRKLKTSPLFVDVLIKSNLNMEELAIATSNRKYLDAISINSKKIRHYINGENYISILGYVGQVSAKDLTDKNKKLTNLDYVGKTGIEKEYDDYLFGSHGKEIVGVNAYGRTLTTKKLKDPVKGKDLHLTIDSELQDMAYNLLGEEKGAVVALDPNSGEILAMASTPTFDPNKLVTGISKKEYSEIFMNPDKSPLFNRALTGQYPPASTIKPFISIAGLLGKWIDPNKKVWCGPYYQIKGSTRKFNDWKRTGHGWITMKEAIEVSADVYYYRLGQTMGIDYIHDIMAMFGFGKKTEIQLNGEKSGLLPSTKWKKEAKKEGWYTGETLISSIGQGFMMSTPTQLAQATAIMVNGGKVYKPLLIKEEKRELLNEFSIPQNILNIAKEGMRDVIFGKKGTARRFKNIVRYNQGGKTGTSQVYSTKGERPDKDVEIPKHLRDHGLYIGFAPYDNPKIAISVVVENNSGSDVHAAEIGIRIMQKYLDKNYPEYLMEGKEVLKEDGKNGK